MTAVYKAIAAVQGELAKVGIAKANRNSQQGYNFRGIDDVYAALSPLLAKHGLCVIPRVIERTMLEKTTSKGNPLFYVTVHAEFDFVSSEDGTKHTAATYGEAMDSGDKATNKAMSAAYKYAAFMTFAIPTEGDNDADATTHDVAPSQEPNRQTGRKLDGPYTSTTALEKAIKAFVVEMGKVADLDEWYSLKNSAADLLAQAERDHPDWWNGWPSQPDGFTPLRRKIEILETQLGEAADNKEAA